MEIKDLLTLIGLVPSCALVVVTLLIYRSSLSKKGQIRRIKTEKTLSWHKTCLHTLICMREYFSMCALHAQNMPKNTTLRVNTEDDLRKTSRRLAAKLSAEIEHGRFFFPDIYCENFSNIYKCSGQDAVHELYRGVRDSALDFLLIAHHITRYAAPYATTAYGVASKVAIAKDVKKYKFILMMMQKNFTGQVYDHVIPDGLSRKKEKSNKEKSNKDKRITLRKFVERTLASMRENHSPKDTKAYRCLAMLVAAIPFVEAVNKDGNRIDDARLVEDLEYVRNELKKEEFLKKLLKERLKKEEFSSLYSTGGAIRHETIEAVDSMIIESAITANIDSVVIVGNQEIKEDELNQCSQQPGAPLSAAEVGVFVSVAEDESADTPSESGM